MTTSQPADPDAGSIRVAYVMSRFPKLTETFILREMLAMEALGVEIELFPLLRERADLVQPGAGPFIERAHYLPFLSRRIVASQWSWLREPARRRRYLRAFFDMLAGTWRSPNFLLGGIGIFPKVAHAAREMESLGVDHVHCHFANHPALAGWLIHRLCGIPYSFTAHGSDLHKDRTMLPTKVAEAAFVVTISEDNRRLIESTCGPSTTGRVEVIHCGVDPSAFARRSGSSGDGRLRIVAIGTLHEVKGQTHLIEACRRLVADGVAIDCRLIGDGEDRARLAAQIEDAGLDSVVTLVGQLTGDAVVAELAGADVLVAPSVPTRSGKREGIPVVLMEAMAAGLPVVASRLSGIPELVTDGVDGLLVPPGDPGAIADALASLARDPERRNSMGANGRRRIEMDFDVLANARALITLIRVSLAGTVADRPVRTSTAPHGNRPDQPPVERSVA